MFNNSEEVLKYISDEKVEYLDIRFCDLPGVMQHLTVPASAAAGRGFTNVGEVAVLSYGEDGNRVVHAVARVNEAGVHSDGPCSPRRCT